MFKRIDPVIKLFLYIILLYLIWYIVYNLILVPGGRFDIWLTRNVTQVSIYVLNIVSSGFEILVRSEGKCTIIKDQIRILSVNHACNGQVLYPVFMGFVLVTYGKFINKGLMIVFGFFVIYAVNIIRIISLVFVKIYYPQYLDFNHKYTFVVVIYSVIFAMWVFWAKKFSNYTLIPNHGKNK